MVIRRSLPIVASLLAAALLLAGCGPTRPDAAPEEATAGGGVFPVTVAHKYGSTEIPAQPKRVVTLGLSDQDAVLALGVRPLGAIDWFKERPYGKWPWTEQRWGNRLPEIVGERDDFNLEKILGLKPDLILALYSGMTREQYQELSKIAPTVGQPKDYDLYGAPWQVMTRMTGQALGKTAQANRLIADIDERFAEIRRQNPQWKDRTVAVVDPSQQGKYAVFEKTDAKSILMSEMGFRVPEAINEAAGDNNAAEVSTERGDLIDVDQLVFISGDPTAEQRVRADPVYRELDVAKDNRAVFVSYEDDATATGAAISFNTVLSIPSALDGLVPKLTR